MSPVIPFQELQEKLTTSKWTRHLGDTVPNTFIGSLAAMQPMESIRLCTVYLEQLREWLSNVEGLELIDQLEATKEDSLMGMAVSFDPVHYYPTQGVDAVVGMGLVFKPAYIPTVSFSSLLMTLIDWSKDPKERLSEACITFLNVSPKSEVFPLCRDYPVLLDLSSKRLVSNCFTRSRVMNFRAFKLPLVRVISPRTNEWALYTSMPYLAGSALYLLTLHQEGSLPVEGFRSSSTLCVSLAAPDQDHWAIHQDKKFAKLTKHLTEECQQRQEEAKAGEAVEKEKEDEQEEGKATAPSDTGLPSSTASAMEVSEGEEGPDTGAAPQHSEPTSRPLEHMLKDMNLTTKDEDLIFPITNVGGPPPYNHELSAENWDRAEATMWKICSFHLQAIYNAMGGVRQVDRILAELLMAQFTRTNQMMGKDLNTSLWELFSVEFLQSNEEIKKLITSLSERISTFKDCIWELALSEELAEEEVALHVNLALTATRPVIGNYFSGVLEGLVGRLGIRIHEDKSIPHSTQEGIERCLTEDLQWSSASSSTLEGCES